jgi:Ca-activated chloride channel homolog
MATANTAMRLQLRRASARHGATSILMAIMLPGVLAICAYAINVAYMEQSRTEFQIVIDVASRAAGRVYAVSGDINQAIAEANRMMELNKLTKTKITTEGVNFELGVTTRDAETSRYQFSKGKRPNAIQIQANGSVQVPMLFPTMGVSIDFRPIKKSTITKAEVDLSLVIDCSGSMAFSDSEIAGNYKPESAPDYWTFGQAVPNGSRWLDAVEATKAFLQEMADSPQRELVSLVSYRGIATTDVALTDNYDSLTNSLYLHSQNFWGGPTNIGDGIMLGSSTLSNKRTARVWASRVMIVLTDGLCTLGVDPIEAARDAAENHITVYTVTFSAEADQDLMRQVADVGNGRHYHARSRNELIMAFKDISTRLPTLITD